MGWLRPSARGVVAGVSLLVATGGAVALLAPVRGQTAAFTDGQVSGRIAVLLLLAATALVAAGAVAWFARPGGLLALLGFAAAAAWLAPELAGSPGVTREARSVGLLLAPMVAPLLAHLPIRALRADAGHTGVRWLLAVMYGAFAAVSIGHALTWDPFRALDCAPVCRQGDNVFLVDRDIALSTRLVNAGFLAAAAIGLSLAAWAVRRLTWGQRPERWREGVVLVPALATGLSLTWWSIARLVVPPERTDAWFLGPTVALSVAVSALGAGVAWWLVCELRRAEDIRRLAELLDAGAGSRSLRDTLVTTLGDPTVRVIYPMGDGGPYLDETGDQVPAFVPTPGRAVAVIERVAGVVALVEHAPSVDADLLTRRVGAAARLAVDNERLEATLRAQLRELKASRSRIVAAGDTARGRLERDLHDGAQQRLLAVSYELRLAQAAAGTRAAADPARTAALDDAVAEIDRVLVELRDLAHGIHPAVLTEAGLDAALRSLADESAIVIAIDDIPDARFPADAERAAYLSVAEAVRRAGRAGIARLDVRVRQDAATLRVEVAGERLGDAQWLRVEDRVGAAGGRTTVTTDATGGTLLVVELPCV